MMGTVIFMMRTASTFCFISKLVNAECQCKKKTITMTSALGSYPASAGKKGTCFAYKLSNRIEDTLQLRSVTPLCG